MLNSMTSYERLSKSFENKNTYQFEIEIRTVNSRFLDVQFKLPKEYQSKELELKKLVSKVIKRGRVEVVIYRTLLGGSETKKITFNKNLYNQYLEVARNQYNKEFGEKTKFLSNFASELLLKNDLFEINDNSLSKIEDSEYDAFLGLFSECLKKIKEMRMTEGLNLEKDILSLIDNFGANIIKIVELFNIDKLNLKDKVLKKYNDLTTLLGLDDQRLMTEVAIIQEKLDISEEITRLKSHIEQYKFFIASESNGKKLEFLTQECLREVNTIASKTDNIEITNLVVQNKSFLEKIKEQLANIE